MDLSYLAQALGQGLNTGVTDYYSSLRLQEDRKRKVEQDALDNALAERRMGLAETEYSSTADRQRKMDEMKLNEYLGGLLEGASKPGIDKSTFNAYRWEFGKAGGDMNQFPTAPAPLDPLALFNQDVRVNETLGKLEPEGADAFLRRYYDITGRPVMRGGNAPVDDQGWPLTEGGDTGGGDFLPGGLPAHVVGPRERVVPATGTAMLNYAAKLLSLKSQDWKTRMNGSLAIWKEVQGYEGGGQTEIAQLAEAMMNDALEEGGGSPRQPGGSEYAGDVGMPFAGITSAPPGTKLAPMPINVNGVTLGGPLPDLLGTGGAPTPPKDWREQFKNATGYYPEAEGVTKAQWDAMNKRMAGPLPGTGKRGGSISGLPAMKAKDAAKAANDKRRAEIAKQQADVAQQNANTAAAKAAAAGTKGTTKGTVGGMTGAMKNTLMALGIKANVSEDKAMELFGILQRQGDVKYDTDTKTWSYVTEKKVDVVDGKGKKTGSRWVPHGNARWHIEGLNKQYAGTGAPAPPPPAGGKAGLITPGNIDLHKRPIIHNPDGSISTVFSMTFTDDKGRAVLVPGVNDTRKLTADEAWKQYKKTGKHLGIFKTEASADAYAQTLHQDQAKEYQLKTRRRGDGATAPPPPAGGKTVNYKSKVDTMLKSASRETRRLVAKARGRKQSEQDIYNALGGK